MFQENKFGMVKFRDKKYRYDVIVHLDESIEKRNKDPSKRKYGTSHKLSAEEVRGLLAEDPDVLVVGCGQYGVLKVGEDAIKLLSTKKVELVDLPTQQAIDEFNRLKNQGRKVTAIVHVTC